MIWVLTIFLLLFPDVVFSRTTIVTGNAPEYAGISLVFYEYHERVFDTKNKIFEIIPDEEGNFKAEFEINDITYLFTESGALHYYFYASPGKSYIINLPSPREKNQQEIRNPYFIPSSIHLETNVEENAGCQDINEVIKHYDYTFESFYNKQVLRYYMPEYSREKLDSFLMSMKEIRNICNDNYFSLYKHYKTGLLEFTVNQFNMNDILEKYFIDKPVLFSLPPYWELFNKVFDKYFTYLTNFKEYNELYKFIAAGNYRKIDSLLKNDPVMMNDTIRDLVLLKEIHNEFHSGYFSVSVLSAVLDSIALLSGSEISRELALYIKEQNTRLLPGSKVPDLFLTDIYGNKFNINDIRGKFIYLGFCDPGLLECQKEFEYLRYFHENFRDKLCIIIATDNYSVEDLNKLAVENGYSWIMTIMDEPGKALRDFNVKGFPAFYFIGPGNSFMQSPANMPSDGFEKILFPALRGRMEKSSL